jgi:hypothetical protein
MMPMMPPTPQQQLMLQHQLLQMQLAQQHGLAMVNGPGKFPAPMGQSIPIPSFPGMPTSQVSKCTEPSSVFLHQQRGVKRMSLRPRQRLSTSTLLRICAGFCFNVRAGIYSRCALQQCAPSGCLRSSRPHDNRRRDGYTYAAHAAGSQHAGPAEHVATDGATAAPSTTATTGSSARLSAGYPATRAA